MPINDNQINNSYNIQTNNLITNKPIENERKKNCAHCLILCDCSSSNQTVNATIRLHKFESKFNIQEIQIYVCN